MAPALYSRLKALYTGPHEPQPPPINTFAAIALLTAYALFYVLPFYAHPATRPSATLSRDAPSVIRARIRSVSVSCMVCCIVTFVLLASVQGGTPVTALHQMGAFPIGLPETIGGVALTATLFLGPLFEAGIAEGGWRDWVELRGVDEVLRSWIGWRNLVAGPVTEEILFRTASVAILLLSRTSNRTTIFLTPVIFGLAHIHHFYEFRITHPHTPVVNAVARSLLQFAYTTFFGGYATFLFLRTGSLLCVVLVHAFCNWMGFPRFWGRLTRDAEGVDEGVGGMKRSEDEGLSRGRTGLALGWTVAYYVLLVVGAVAWYRCLWSWTESTNALTTFAGHG